MGTRWWIGWAAAILAAAAASSALPAAAQYNAAGSYGNAAACLTTAARLATTRAVDTIYAPQSSSTGAVYRLTVGSGNSSLIPVGVRSGGSAGRISAGSGIGSVYGLAYDNGARSGIERLFIGAFARRTASYGPAGPGGVYEYRFADSSWRTAFTVPNAGSDRDAATTASDQPITAAISTTSLGDLEISPDGRRLYISNLRQRRIEQYDITVDPPLRLTPLSIPFNLISGNSAVQAELMPFALEFHPQPAADGGARLFVGITDRALRSGSLPALTVVSVAVNSLSWQVELRQALRDGSFASRLSVSNFQRQVDFVYPDDRLQGWYSWSTTREPLHQYSHQRVVFHPQPLLSDIEFLRNGARMVLGLRDRVSDTQMLLVPPSPYVSSIGQGDLLGYQAVSGGWELISSSTARVEQAHPTSGQSWTAHRSDAYNDQVLNYSGSEPWYVENAQGALASIPTEAVNRQIAWTALLGNGAVGINRAADTAPAWLGRTTAFSTASNAAPTGDLELLCQTALIGGRVWFDSDRDGMVDTDEPRPIGVRIEAYLPDSAEAAASTVTDRNGLFRFIVEANRPLRLRIAATEFAAGGQLHGWYFTRGFVSAAGSAASNVSEAYGWIEFADDGGLSGQAALPPLRDSQQYTFNFGLSDAAPSGSVGDWVWLDSNGDGRQATDEPGIAAQAVQLLRQVTAAPSYRTSPLTTVSAADGSYRFSAVEPGVYRLQLPAGSSLLPTQALSGDAAGDSEITAQGESGDIVLLTAQQDLQRDIGLRAAQANLQLSAQHAAQVSVGASLPITLTVTAQGEPAGSVVTLTLAVPAGFSAADAAWTAADGQLSRQLATPTAGEPAVLAVTLQAPAQIGSATELTVSLTAWLSGTAADDDAADNTLEQPIRLVRPELVLSKQAADTAPAGGLLVYNLQLHNHGSAAAGGALLIRDRLPAGLTLQQLPEQDGLSCRQADEQLLECLIVDGLAAGHGLQLIYEAQIAVEAPPQLINEAQLVTAVGGDLAEGNTAQAQTQIVRPDLQPLLVLPPQLRAGETTTLTLVINNHGSGDSGAISVRLQPSADLQLTLPDADCSTAVSGLICLLDGLAPASARQTELALTAAATAGPSVSLTVTVSSEHAEQALSSADNRLTGTAAVERPAIAVTLQAPPAIVGAGSVYPYTISISNNYAPQAGLTLAAAGVQLTLTLAADTTLYAAEPAATTIDGQRLSWQLGALQPGETRQLTVLAATTAAAGRWLTATAEISTAGSGDDPADNRAVHQLAVVLPPTAIGSVTPTLQLLAASQHDPLMQDGDPANGVHLISGARLVWPVGEVLDLGVAAGEPQWAGELPWPYGYRVTAVGWSLDAITVDGTRYDARSADSRGLAGCRAGDRPWVMLSEPGGCPYRPAADAERGISERALAGQAHLAWVSDEPGLLRSDLFVYRAQRPQVQLELTLETAVEIVNLAPGEAAGLELPPWPLHELPAAERRRISGSLTIDLLIPRRAAAQ
jgi:hypothetical protein